MINNLFRAAIAVSVLFSSQIFGQLPIKTGRVAVSSSAATTGFMPLSEIREGMRGTARTVFRGNEPEEFNVEILGVVPGGVGPKQDLIIGKISGGSADRTSVFAGMSGSPVYINGKLVGAISYSFPFSKEPICGITPIEQMVAIFEQRPLPTAKSVPRSFSFGELASTNWQPDFSPYSLQDGSRLTGMSPDSMLMSVAGQTFRPIATPVTFNGISQTALDRFAPQLLQAGLIPVAAAGGTSPITPLKKADQTTLQGGDSVSMHLTRGDYGIAASGTVTLRDGEKIYAFGHPFLGLGTSELPMSESHVVTVIPSVNNSFKLAVADSMVGVMTQDRATGVYGKLGTAPKMIPVRLNLVTSRGQTETYNFEVVRDDFLTPLLLNITIYNSLVAQERSIGDSTIFIDGEIKVKGNDPIKLERRFAGGQALQISAGSVAAPVSALLRGRFDGLEISCINVDLKVVDGSSTATLERLAIDRTQVRAGETLEVQAFARTSSGEVFVQRIPVKIGSEMPAGIYSVTVGDGGVIQKNDAIQQFTPRDLAELIDTINKIRLPDRLYAKTFRTTSGAVIGSSEMPNLPPSVLATLNNDRMTGGVKPSVQTVTSVIEIAPANFIISGEQTLTFEVIK